MDIRDAEALPTVCDGGLKGAGGVGGTVPGGRWEMGIRLGAPAR